MQPSGPDQYMTRVNLLRTSGSPIKGLSVLIENHTSQGGDKQWCESSTTTQWPHQPKVMGMEERSHMSMNCIFMHVYTHNLSKKKTQKKNKNTAPTFRWYAGHIWHLFSLQRMECEGKWHKPQTHCTMPFGHWWGKRAGFLFIATTNSIRRYVPSPGVASYLSVRQRLCQRPLSVYAKSFPALNGKCQLKRPSGVSLSALARQTPDTSKWWIRPE